jgi:hypothetical protein
MIRQPAVAGQFYNASPGPLAAASTTGTVAPQPAIAVVTPCRADVLRQIAGAVYAR